MKKITFTVPKNQVEEVKNAMWSAGAGKYLTYDQQAWQVAGVAEFRPLEGANPHIGTHGKLERVEEYRVEIYCQEKYLKPSIEALLKSHPYEIPQFDVVSIESEFVVKKPG